MNRGAFFDQFHKLEQADLDLLQERIKPRQCTKGEFLCVPGQVQKELYFVNSGVQMSYFDSGERTHVVAFTYPPGLCAIPDSFQFQTPSRYFLTCLTDSALDAVSFDALQDIFEKSPAIERLFRKMTEAILAGVLNRHMELHSLSMEERFKAFGRRSPHLLQMVPHKYIASYLGMDPTNFSKLFNRVIL